MGLWKSLIPWLADFLSKRYQAEHFRDAIIIFHSLTYRVSQAKKIGSLCFHILISGTLMDAPAWWKYLDDSAIGTSIHNGFPDYLVLQNTRTPSITSGTNYHQSRDN